MPTRKIQLEGLKPNAAAELTEADIAHVTGWALSRQLGGTSYTTGVPLESISLNDGKIERQNGSLYGLD